VNFIVEDCDARLVLYDAARRGLLRAGLPQIQIEDDFVAFIDVGEFAAVDAEPAERVMFLYTSGSTGRPKGVVLSHQSHLWVLEMRTHPAPPPGQRVLVAAPLYHMNALALSKLACAAHATIVLLPQFSTTAYIEAIE